MNEPDFRIRTATAQDAPCIAALATHAFLDTYATDGMRPDLARGAFAARSIDTFSSRLTAIEGRTYENRVLIR